LFLGVERTAYVSKSPPSETEGGAPAAVAARLKPACVGEAVPGRVCDTNGCACGLAGVLLGYRMAAWF